MSAITDPRRLALNRANLEIANEVRMRRAELKVRLGKGRIGLQPFIANPPRWLWTAEVGTMVEAVRLIGRIRARTILRRANVDPVTRFRNLTIAERRALMDELDLGEAPLGGLVIEHLSKLDAGGWVDEDEVRYRLGDGAVEMGEADRG